MGERKRVIFSILFATFLHISYGCQIEGVTEWALPVMESILDTFEGTVTSKAYSDIEAITGVGYGEATNAGPYFDLSLVNSQFVIQTNSAFRNYEEVEVASRVSLTVDFRCTGGTTSRLMVWIDITDTNNNPPKFLPTDEFEFVVAPPLPPGFLVTGCFNDITVRDIDLTTQRIDFTIEDNPYFAIEYDASSSTVAKEFKAILRTTTFIRSLSEPVILTITATDVDQTNDPPRSKTATVRILGDSEFQFPEEPVFGQTFYLANYTEDHQLNLFETISLQQGFDEYVSFTLEGDYSPYFDLSKNGNEVSIVVTSPLPNDIWPDRQIFLIVRADREFTSGDTTTIVVQLPEEVALEFERVYYEGTIINNGLQLSPLVLSQGFEVGTVSAQVVGEYSTYFSATVQGNLVTLTMAPLMDVVIDNNSFISLQVVAASERSVATTVVNLEIIKDDNVTPVFDKSIYSGVYDSVTGLTAEQISFVQGFDDTVTINLAGEYANYFQYSQNGPIITLTSSSIPPELYSQQHILISIEASKPRTVGANAAIHITLPAARELEFEASTYRGTIEGTELTLGSILLRNGYQSDVNFDLSGEYASYFTATNVQNQVTIALSSPLPDTPITQNSVIMLTLTASGLNAVTTSTSVLLDVIKDDTTTPVFSQNIYYGTYSGATVNIQAINLAQGFDNSVSFRIDGAHSQYFSIINNGNNAEITLQSPIPDDVIFNEKVLLFNVFADKALTVGANAAVLIRFPTELTDIAVMRFSQNTYFGTLEENEMTMENIVLDTGFATGTEFLLTGDYADYFALSYTNNIVHISNLNTLPNEVVEDNDFIVLEIEARRQRAVSVWTSVVIDIVKKEIVAPVFSQAYYTGVYTEEAGLTFEEAVHLSEGYDETVTFALSGESASWFSPVQEGNSVFLVLNTNIPADVLENNNQLLFTIIANKPTSIIGRAVISIDLPKDFSDSSFRFQQDFYKGYIEDGNLILGEMVLEDYTSEVTYTLGGDYADYFQLINQNGMFTLERTTPLPTPVLEEINIFVFTLQVQNTNIRTHTTIILENIKENDDATERLKFEQPYYIGTYSESALLQFETEIRLTTEMDQSVEFDLEGEYAEWFGLVPSSGNSVTLTLTSPIPAAVLANNQQLVFVVTAQGLGSETARATIVISLLDENIILGFDRVSYIGTIENNQANIPTITLSEGFTQGVTFSLHGDLANYFVLTPQGAIVTVTLRGTIPEQSIPANGIIVLEIQAAAPQAINAYATIVIDNVKDDDVSTVVELIFAQTFYSGSYTAAVGLSFLTPISLAQGYDTNVVFDLEGDNAQWFSLVPSSSNSVTLTLTSPIPAAVLANNQQLVFVVTAQSPGSATARSTVVISLLDEYPEGSAILGFDRVTYLGTIENNQANIPTITLSEGFTQGVTFSLHGDLADYFVLTPQGAIVTVMLRGTIPEQSIPANGIIVLEIQAAAPQAINAYATIVIDNVKDDDVSTVVELIIAQTFYSGSYTAAAGLSFLTPISLAQGYDTNVVFDLEGDNAQWFSLVPSSSNSVTLTLTSPIPAAVLANNQQLVFVVTAQSPGSATARSTVVISLLDEYPEGSAILGFDRVTYLGTIENNQANIPTITLSEGFTQGVTFSLHGDLADYFVLTPQGAIVTVTLRGTIPEQSIPANGIIVLEIQAAAPQAINAYATIVIDNVKDDDVSTVVELIFAQTFYSGSYTAAAGLSFLTPISLAQGYDTNVVFDLEGDNAQWFGLVPSSSNSVTLTLTSPIPAAVLANNQQLVFVVTAQSPGSATARSTVVISLLDEYPDGSAILGFDRVTYLGTIENNQANIPTITLSEGFTQGVTFSLHGDLADYFVLTPQGAIVTVTLRGTIPEQSIPANGIIVLEIQAAAPQAINAYATIVIDNVKDDDVSTVVELIFAQTFYSGSYTTAAGLSFLTPISLAQGYDTNVVFDLEGDNAQWFSLVPSSSNSVTLTLTSPIPAAVLANNQQLVFVVTAQSPGSATARSTVVISLLDEYPEGSAILGFDRVTYLGTIENNQANIPTITLSEGFTQGVTFSLHGDLADYFVLTPQGAIVTVTLRGTIPEQSIPANGIIVLEIQAAAPQAINAYATIVIDNVKDDDVSTVVELIFAQTFYSGSYTAAAGLSFLTPISLAQGYDTNVVFDLEGDNAQWFSLVPSSSNSVTLTLTSPIPAAVLANNQQLVFVVTAQSPGSATARSTVVISLLDEYPEGSAILGFDRVTYLGTIENNQANIPTITLSEGFTQGVTFSLHGDLADYFVLTPQGAIVTVTLRGTIPEQSIPANGIIVLEIQAAAPQAINAYATIVIDNVKDDDVSTVVELIFAQTFYSGSYTAAAGLSFLTPISLAQGYDTNVVFDLEGDNAQWFGLVPSSSNSVTLTLTSPIPAAVLANNQQLVFVVTAQSPGSATARSTVVISLLDEYPEGSAILGFDRVTYLGTIENNQANIPTITLSEGFTQGVTFSLHGDLADYFVLTPQGAIVTVTLRGTIPEQSIPANGIIVLEIQAAAPQAINAYATIVIDNVKDDDVSTVVELIFAQTFYSGSYTAAAGLSFLTPISLAQGYDTNVVFDLEGDNAQWFGLVPSSSNSVTLTLTSPIPAAVLANNQQLVFVVTAQSPGSATARSTVVISLLDEYPEGSAILGFDRVTYLGTIENNQANIPTITLSEGFTQGVTFSLHGDLADYFVLTPQGAIVTVTLRSTIPEQSIPANGIIVLEIQAAAPQAINAYATIVIDNVKDDDVSTVVELIFAQTFYSGSYTAAAGLSFLTPISLAQGYDTNVVFDLEGDNAQWFSLVPSSSNSVTLTLTSPIPAAVLANNQQLVFVVTAQSPGSATARSTVVISLLDEYPEGSAILGFDRVTYLGTIENNQANIPTITLSEGFTQGVTFSLHGDLADYFVLTPQGAIVTVTLRGTIPEQSIPANGIIVLEIQAAAPQAINAYATIVIDNVKDDDVSTVVELIFAQTFYSGSYTAAAGLSFLTPISLAQGYDTNVVFDLEGDNAQWFSLVPSSSNSVTLTLTSPIPAAVLANNQQLVFVVTAQSPGSATARSTVVISLLDEYPDGSAILGFDRVTYLGTIENNQANIPTITLSEGFTQGVTFSLHGDLADYFVLTPQGAIVTVTLRGTIPEQSIPANGIIVLEIQAAAPQAINAYATIVIDNVKDDDVSTVVELIFAQTFYSGSYTAAAGLSFLTPISLAQGYDTNVVFDLEGDNAQWFGLVPSSSNSVTLTLTSPIPAAVLANNQQLVFVVTAQSPGSATARSTVVISLLDEYPEGSAILGFDRVTYLGTIENNQANIPTITLSEGFSQGVTFSLHGDLADYFVLTPQGAIVTVTLRGTIPEQSIPANGIIVLEIQAAAPQAINAYATIVIDNVKDDDVSTVVELIFAQTFYSGSYTAAEGLSFLTPISLAQGYDTNVVFDLEGDNAQWFGLVPSSSNSVTLTLTSPIPAAVLANNQQLVFVVTAQSPGSATARSTVVISLLDEYPEGSAILGFDRVTYLGTIENNQANIPTITLSEGFTQGVTFSLHGDLADYFVLTPQGAIVTVTLRGTIPEQSIPANGIIVLEIQAAAPQAINAYATIVIDNVKDDDVSTVVELIFAQTFYSGSYTAAAGLSFLTPISLAQGYDTNVVFDLEGDNAQWFGLVPSSSNSVTLTLTSPIPAAVLANNQQLVFVVTAQSPGSATARSTVVISLLDEYPEGSAILGFDRVTYLGTIENNQANIPTITLSEGFTQGVTFSLHGDLADYFVLTPQGAIVTVTLRGTIPEQSIPANGIIVLEIQAAAPQAINAYATIVIDNVKDDDVSTVVELIFAQTFYSGSYTAAAGLSFLTPISLAQGYDTNVVFDLEGDNAQWFGLVPSSSNSVTLTLTSPIPAAVLANNQQLVFVVTAQSPGSATARSTVVISLLDEYPEGSDILGFDRVTYLGTIENNQANIPTITLSEGFTQGVTFSLHGDLADYFVLTPQGAIVTVTLRGTIPEQSIPANGIIVLEIQAAAPQAINAYATIVIDNVKDDDVSTVVELIFAQTFYSGSYTAAAGLSFLTPISLAQGYDTNVVFDLEGDNAQWFGLVPSSSNSVSLTLTSPIPAAVLANNQQLVFVVTAQSPGSATARSTVVISLLDEYPEGSAMLGFDRVTYLGTIENNQANIPTITLSEGFTQGVAFSLHGDLADYFVLTPQGAIVTVTLRGTIPEQSIPANGIIVLEIQAAAPQAINAYATIVIDNVKDDNVSTVVELIFAQTFYSGSYTAAAGLSFLTPISLAQGYDTNVVFDLEGDNAQWFGLVPSSSNSVTLTLTSPIPAAVLANNQQLVFVVTAQSPGSATARSTVVISLLDEYPEGSAILGFDRVTYLGTIENNQANIPTITLSEGFTQGVTFSLHGDLADYFVLTPQGAIVTVTLRGTIPEQSIPANGIIVLEIQAAAPQAINAYATIVIDNVKDDDVSTVVELIFAQTFYSGSYTAAAGLSFLTPISLAQGYDTNVVFDLEGDNAQWFGLVPSSSNSVTLTLTSPIPAAVLANNQQLVFVVTAQSPGSATARSTVVISLLDEYPEGSAILGFDRVTYLGTIENNQANIPTITLSEGFTQGVTFSLHGDLADYFVLTPQGAIVTVTLRGTIPEQSIPANGIIVLEIQAAAPQAINAYATIVIDNVKDDDVSTVVELIFAQTFYSGSYTAAAGLSFLTPISLAQGYDTNVVFDLEGDNAQWFGLVPSSSNSVTLTLTSPIPAAVLANNQQLVFVVTAQSPGSATARSTVVISLLDEYPEGSDILGFDRVTYLGTIENNQANIPTITLSEGFTQGVTFSLHGDLADYFVLTPQGAIVTVTLRGTIPEQSIPANGIIVLEIQAAAPQAINAYATIVIDNVKDDDVSTVVELIFAQTFYSGSYTAAAGLSFLTPISLAQGYDTNVVFDLEGDNAQWFGLVPSSSNSVSLTLTSPIPAAVLANNQQLVFVVTAQSPGSATARSTVVISLLDEYPEGSAMLGFDRVTYLGTIENNQANIPTITLSEGFTQGVAFSLHGDLADYFVLTPQGAIVTVTLRGTIPEQSIPANGIIVLEIQAAAPQAINAYATIVIDNVKDDNVSTVVELIFAQTFYSGSYTAAAGLSFLTPISLAQGYDTNVVFDLEGDNAQWFGLVPSSSNSVTLTLTSPIPAAVLANNQQLVFVVTAQSPGSATARSTVVISLLDEYPEGSAILGFDRVTYLGTIENNQANIPTITLSEGFTQGVTFSLHGDLADYFVLTPQGAIVTVTLRGTIPEQSIPANGIIVLEIQAAAPQAINAYATIVIDNVKDDDVSTVVELIFAQTFYSGSYTAAAGLSFLTPISLAQGYDTNVVFDLEGDNAQWFGLVPSSGNSVTLTLTSPIPAAVLANNQQLVFVVTAQSPGSATARSTVIISLIDDSQPGFDVTFEKVLFEGVIENGVVTHEIITITGFSGSIVELYGEYSSQFMATFSNNVVTVTALETLVLPTDVSHMPLELRAGTASAVLLLNVIHTETPTIPTVRFSSSSYTISVDITYTGLVGRVQASADNGEALTYSLQLESAHLQERLSINAEGELHLSAPVNTGATFDVVATTIFTQTRGTAPVHLSVQAITVCGDEIVMPPLIVVDVDEEEPHYDLINGAQYENCHFTLANRWPLEQSWLYVDERGLHTTAIDREHESIAFMPVSQVQVEITLHCESDATRTKRSSSNALGPYDYGNNKWILTDTILYNSRRSFVNVIVNDINDNAPIFVGKENEPIAVGYPVPDLAERVLPRSLAELQATDADIGENAALVYWSSAPELAVAPTTGFVHLRDGATLENGVTLTVSATDRNGEGLTGSINLLVRLLDENYIAVVTIRDAFLDDEQTVLSSLTEAVGYEVKALRSVVISDEVETDEVTSRAKPDIMSVTGATLQLYVYGLIVREPVSVDRLTTDLSNIVIGPVIVANSVSLQDHLEGQEICDVAGRDTGLLVATIILSVLLFILLVLIAVWFFLRWRKNRNYDEFSDENSLASRNESVDKLPRPEVLPKPRLDIGELKKSERRLQEMLDAPFQEITVDPMTSRKDAILDMPTPEPLAPIVIQSIDKLKDAADESSEDEFGETKGPKRKSVVTFNENVEKIIHVEDSPDIDDVSADPDYEVYKL